jgi:hypothetical protein
MVLHGVVGIKVATVYVILFTQGKTKISNGLFGNFLIEIGGILANVM